MTGTLSQNIEPHLLFAGLDIGGTNSAAVATLAVGGDDADKHWVPMTNHHRVCFVLHLGIDGEGTVWTEGDEIATVTVQQATANDGTSIKAVTSQTYAITAGDLDAHGDKATFELTADQLDVSNGFDHVRILVAMTDNNGVNAATAYALLYQPWYNKISQDKVDVQHPEDGFGT